MNAEQKTALTVAAFSFALWTAGNVIIIALIGWKVWLGIFLLVTSYNIKWRT